MRRLIGYITASIAMLLGIGVAATPVITGLSTGREYTDSRNYREVVFNIAENTALTDEENKERANTVADEMVSRLANYGVEDYSIKIQGEDTVAVSLNMNKTKFNYAAKYLTFSGESFALVSSNSDTSIKNEHTLFKPEDVYVQYEGDASVPVIIIPLTTDGIADVKALISEFPEESSETDDENKKQDIIYLWANLDEENGENLSKIENDPIARDKILLAFGKDSLWNPDSDEAETELFYMCAEGTEENPNELDVSGLESFNERASYLINMLKANEYDFEISCPTAIVTNNPGKGEFATDYFTNARVLEASGEKLFGIDANSIINVKSKTFISSCVAIVIISLLLVIFYRLAALGMIATTLGTLFISLIAFMKMNALFNIPAVVGLLILGSASLFGQIFHASKLKEEIYKGRSIKKANQEASKKSNLPIIDSAVVTAISGLMMYAIGDAGLKPVGIALFFGAIFTLLMNLLVFKFLMHMLTNSTNLQDKYEVFNVDKDKVPNLMQAEEKETYVAPYEKVDFTKKKSIISIIFGALVAAAVACIVTFGVMSPNGSPLNISEAVKDTTVCYVTLDITDNSNPAINDVETFKNYALTGLDIGAGDDDIEIKETSVYAFDGEKEASTKTYFVSIQNVVLGEDQIEEDLEVAIMNNINEIMASENNSVMVRTSKELVYTPDQGLVALATGLSIVGVALYAAFRFRPSKAIALACVSAGATAIAYGAIVGLHFIGTTALTSVAMPVVAVTTMLASLFFLNTEKSIRLENHDVLTYELRKEITIKAIGKSASTMLLFMLCSIYVAINFFGFGLENSVMLFGSVIIGEIVSAIALLCILGPLADVIAKGLGKIKLPKLNFLKKENKNKVSQVKKTSEPEETIFIGIND